MMPARCVLLLRGGPWDRGLIRNVVIRILAWSKIRKAGAALRRRRAREPPVRPQQILYLYGTRRTTQQWSGRTIGARWYHVYMLLALRCTTRSVQPYRR